jgi:hypothetical protein
VRYKVGTLIITSPQQVADFYADFHEYCREHVEIADFAMTGDTVVVVMPSRFEPFRDYVKHGLEFRAGRNVEFVSFIFYKLKDGGIRRIRVGRPSSLGVTKRATPPGARSCRIMRRLS